MNIAQILFDGVIIGVFYALVAVGFVIVFRVSGVFNFAHPAFMLVGALVYLAVADESSWSDFLLGLLASVVVTGGLSAAAYPLVMKWVTGRPHYAQMVVTFGMSIVLLNLSQYFLGSRTRHPEIPISDAPVSLPLDVRTSVGDLVWTGVGVLVCLAVVWATSGSSLGARIRAIAEDVTLAGYAGIRVPTILLVVWGIAGVLAAIAGIVYGSRIQIDASMMAIGLAAFPAAMLGGMDSPGGVLVGGVTLGVLQTAGAAAFGPTAAVPIGFAAMFLFLMVLPHGIFGTRPVERV